MCSNAESFDFLKLKLFLWLFMNNNCLIVFVWCVYARGARIASVLPSNGFCLRFNHMHVIRALNCQIGILNTSMINYHAVPSSKNVFFKDFWLVNILLGFQC